MKLKNLIFDLGDVIIPIDLSAPLRHFSRMAQLPEATVQQIWNEHNLWHRYETGLIDDKTFRADMRRLLKSDAWADEAIDAAWNAVLLELPAERIERLKELKGTYRLFLLSNTSPIHIREVNRRLADMQQPPLDELFEKVFYSYEARLAKPSPDIYRYVLKQAGIKANETAFFDDNAANIAAAAELGIQAVQVCAPKTILDYLQDV